MTSETKRRLYTLLVTAINILVQVLFVGYVWWRYYNPMIPKAYWFKGHIYIMSLYAIVLLLFMHIYGATRVGYFKRWDAMLSHLFATICANVFFYAEIALLAYKFPTVKPLVAATVLAFIFELIWLKLVLHWYRLLFPPHKVLLVYGRRRSRRRVRSWQNAGISFRSSGRFQRKSWERRCWMRMMRSCSGTSRMRFATGF